MKRYKIKRAWIPANMTPDELCCVVLLHTRGKKPQQAMLDCPLEDIFSYFPPETLKSIRDMLIEHPEWCSPNRGST